MTNKHWDVLWNAKLPSNWLDNWIRKGKKKFIQSLEAVFSSDRPRELQPEGAQGLHDVCDSTTFFLATVYINVSGTSDRFFLVNQKTKLQTCEWGFSPMVRVRWCDYRPNKKFENKSWDSKSCFSVQILWMAYSVHLLNRHHQLFHFTHQWCNNEKDLVI